MFWLGLLKTAMELVTKFFAVREREQFKEMGQQQVRAEVAEATRELEERFYEIREANNGIDNAELDDWLLGFQKRSRS